MKNEKRKKKSTKGAERGAAGGSAESPKGLSKPFPSGKGFTFRPMVY